MRIVSAAAVAAAVLALPALAFFPSEDSRDGVTARFVGFDEASDRSGLVAARRDAGEPFEIRLDIANSTDSPVSGDLSFWLNDDWEVSPGGAGGSPAETWRLPNGLSLPADGFYAETPDARAGIVEIAGRRCAFSQSGASTFVDGRPDRHDGTGPADTANASALADFADLGIQTDGAFRLERDGATGDLLLTPIPGSAPFRAEIDLAKAGVPGFASGRPAATPLRGCEPIEPSLDAAWPDWCQKDGVLSLSVDSKSFAYRLVF